MAPVESAYVKDDMNQSQYILYKNRYQDTSPKGHTHACTLVVWTTAFGSLIQRELHNHNRRQFLERSKFEIFNVQEAMNSAGRSFGGIYAGTYCRIRNDVQIILGLKQP